MLLKQITHEEKVSYHKTPVYFLIKIVYTILIIRWLLVNVAKKKFKKAVANPLHCSLLNYIYNMHL